MDRRFQKAKTFYSVPSGIMPISPPKPLLPKSVTSPQAMTKDGNLERSILAIISPELSSAIQALNSIENVRSFVNILGFE